MADSTDTPGDPMSRPTTATRDTSDHDNDHADASSSTVAAPAASTPTRPSQPSQRGGAGPESSFFDAAPIDNTMAPDDNVSEAAVRQHLKDVESSFLPVLSPIPTAPSNGEPAVDDTFLFDSPQKVDRPPLQPVHDNKEPDTTAVSSTTSNLEAFDSSPTAAAAARTVSRAVSMASDATRQAYDAEDDNGVGDESFASSLDHNDSRWSQSQRSDRVDAGSTPGFALRKQRPRFLRSRFGSQRSSTSSFLTNAESFDDGDITSNQDIDMALQSGGVLPTMGMPRLPSNVMQRTVSIGSIASGVGTEDFGDTSQQLEPLPEIDTPVRGTSLRFDPLKTPKPSRENLNATPTDTVIAQHVKNVHVPESLAKEYKFRSGLETPFRPTNANTGAGTVSRTGKSLTLKEQSSTIEKLSKENFDLKLKVMFLSDRLDKLSEEGIKEMISENVELKTNLAVLQRDNKVLRKRVKELEKRIKEDEERPSTGGSSNDQASRLNEQEVWEREQELIFLRERVEEYAIEIEKLRTERMSKESEKKKLADIVKSLGERTGEKIDRQEEADVWRDLLEQETAHREQTEDDNVRLRDEVFKLKKEMAAVQSGHTTNIYNIAKRQRDRAFSPNKPPESESSNAGFSAASTLVDELRRESEKLRHENAELRREVGAQTSMLTSRNREKDRLQQEIEDLKISQGRGGATSTADSILERSASRAGARYDSPSRVSARTLPTAVEDEREDLENRLAEARDRISEVKMANQDLQRELAACMTDFEMLVAEKREGESQIASLQDELGHAVNDLQVMQAERDTALYDCGQIEANFEELQLEAEAQLEELDGEVVEKCRELEILQADLADRAENFDALQNAMREMSQSVIGLEDEQNKKLRRIQQLEAEIESSNRELEAYELKLSEESEKNRRLAVQQESSQSEIAFLREEQEADKIRIGDLEAAIANAEQSLRDEKDRARELDERLQQERAQREMVANQEKEEVQQFVNELNREASAAQDEARKLRKNLSSREVEATAWKERLNELENNLRVTLGDLNGTRSSLLGSIARIQRDLENTVRELDVAKASVVEKDRLIKQRDALLESLGLESQKASEMLEKERLAHRHTKSDYETFQRTHQHLSRTASTQDVRIAELESTRGQERRKLAILEQSAREQLMERNELLLQLWKRLSVLCGREWAHSHTLVDKQAVPSIDVVSSRLPGFTKNLMAAIKMIENMLKSFEGKINSVERDLTREYQALESNLDMRAKRLDRVESLVRNQIASGGAGAGALGSMSSQELRGRVTRVEHAYQKLKVEYETLKTATNVRARAAAQQHGAGSDSPRSGSAGGSPSPAVPRGPGERDKERAAGASSSSRGSRESRIPSSVHHRQGGAAENAAAATDMGLVELAKGGGGGADAGGSYKDLPLMMRLKNLEAKLRTEREKRDQERDAARQRLGDLEEENKGLRGKIQRRQMAE